MLDAAEWTMVAYLMVICFGIGWCCAKMFGEKKLLTKHNQLWLKHANLDLLARTYHKQLCESRLEVRRLENEVLKLRHYSADRMEAGDNGKIYNDGA